MRDVRNQYTQFYQSGLASAVDIMTAWTQGAERLRTQQLEIITRVLNENAGLATRIRKTQTLEGLLAVNADLITTQLRNATSYWTGVGEVVRQNQAALHERGQQQFSELQRQLAGSLDVAANGAPGSLVEAMNALAGVVGLGTVAPVSSSTRSDVPAVATAEAGVREAPMNISRAA